MANGVTADSVGGARGLEGQRDTGSELVGLDCATSHAIEFLVARYCGLASLDVHGYIHNTLQRGIRSQLWPKLNSYGPPHLTTSLRLVSLD